jgi:hypothetical protein
MSHQPPAHSAPLPQLCDQRGRNCCGTPACPNAGTWSVDPYDEPAWTQGHWHSEPVCAWPDCATYLTRSQMAALHVEAVKA